MSLRIVLFLVALAMVAAGASLLTQSAAMPEWTDEARANAVQMWDMPDETASPEDIAAFNSHWRKAIAKLRTDKWPYHDAGMALITFAVSMVASVLLLRINSTHDIAALKTPRRPRSIYMLGIGGWIIYWVSAVLAMLEGFNRSEFPPLPGSELTMILMIASFAATSAIVLAVISYVVLRKSVLPASLWIWRKDMPGHDWFYTVGAGFALLIGLEVLREAYSFGHWLAVPSVFLCVYATLALRAAGIAKNI